MSKLKKPESTTERFRRFAAAYIGLICKTNIDTAEYLVAALDEDNENTGGYDLFSGDRSKPSYACEFADWTTQHFSLGHCVAFLLCDHEDGEQFPHGVYEHRFFDGEVRRMRVSADRVYFTFQLVDNEVEQSYAVGSLDAIWCYDPCIPKHAEKKADRFVQPFL